MRATLEASLASEAESTFCTSAARLLLRLGGRKELLAVAFAVRRGSSRAGGALPRDPQLVRGRRVDDVDEALEVEQGLIDGDDLIADLELAGDLDKV